MGNSNSNVRRTAPEPTMPLTVEPPLTMKVSDPIPTTKVVQRRRKAWSDDSTQQILDVVFTPSY